MWKYLLFTTICSSLLLFCCLIIHHQSHVFGAFTPILTRENRKTDKEEVKWCLNNLFSLARGSCHSLIFALLCDNIVRMIVVVTAVQMFQRKKKTIRWSLRNREVEAFRVLSFSSKPWIGFRTCLEPYTVYIPHTHTQTHVFFPHNFTHLHAHALTHKVFERLRRHFFFKSKSFDFCGCFCRVCVCVYMVCVCVCIVA